MTQTDSTTTNQSPFDPDFDVHAPVPGPLPVSALARLAEHTERTLEDVSLTAIKATLALEAATRAWTSAPSIDTQRSLYQAEYTSSAARRALAEATALTDALTAVITEQAQS